MNNFTPRSQQVLALSRKEADRFNHTYVGTEHLLLGLIRLGQGVAVNVLQKLGLDLETVRLEVEKQVGTGPDTKLSGNIPYTPRVKKVLALAGKEAKALNHSYVGTEHLLLGLLREGDGVSARVLRTLGVDLEKTRVEILKELDPNFAGGGTREAVVLKNPDPPVALDPSAPIEQEINRIAKELSRLEEKRLEFVKKIAAEPATAARKPEITDPVLKPYLAAGETLLWSGAPTPKFRFGPQHLPLLFVLLPFLAFLFLSLAVAFSSHPPDQTKPTAATTETAPGGQVDGTPTHSQTLGERIFLAIFLSLFIGGFAGSFLYVFGGRFLLNRFQLASTLYGVTDRRILVMVGKNRRIVRSYLLDSLSDVRLEEWPDGYGTVSFGPHLTWPYGTKGFYPSSAATLENIPGAGKVLHLIAEARRPA